MPEELFGTDGVRGIPGKYPLDAATVERIAEEAATRLMGKAGAPAVIARDTRGSGPMLAKALAKGFGRAGVTTLIDCGVLPTPGLARVVVQRGAAFGVVVSASHNPPEFNGIKFFDWQGRKLDERVERDIEKSLGLPGRRGDGACRVVPDAQAAADYLDFLVSTFPGDLDLDGMKVVADAANGAAAKLVKPLLERLGARVVLIGDKPNGRNINTGYGALATDAMRREIVRSKADAGFSLDGDADRALLADETGFLLDGDTLIGLSAELLQDEGLLTPAKVVLTVMSNAGLERWLAGRGVGVIRVPVGDRHVTAAMEKERLALGGENSGHIVFGRYAPSGDGMLTALQGLALLRRSGRKLSELRRAVPSFPQSLVAVHVKAKPPLASLGGVSAAIRKAESALGGGRVLVRYSGTEPVLRVLVEGPRAAQVKQLAKDLAAVCEKEINKNGR